MADTVILDRRAPLAGLRAATITPLPPMIRFSLRGRASDLAAVKAVTGVAPSEEACRAVAVGDHAALWLGPDEWLLTAPGENAGALFTKLEEALAAVPHSLVDISHRNTGFLVSGDGATTLLAEGCPLDLDLAACPVGLCTRTVLGKSEVVLWRVATDAFRIECWRSYAPYVASFLKQASENL